MFYLKKTIILKKECVFFMKSGMFEKVVHGGLRQLADSSDSNSVLDFSANLNPFVPPIDWKPDFNALSSYPDDSYRELKSAVARKFRCSADEVTVGNGSIEVIRTFFRAALSAGGHVLTEKHTFGEYDLSIRLAGGEVVHEPNAATRVRVICNPNNPTGELLSKNALLEIAAAESQRGSVLFLDEAFNELATGAESLIGCGLENVFVSRSFTKSFAVPGLRIGFGFGDPELIERMEVMRPPWTLNTFAESFAFEALKHLDELGESRRRIAAEREWLYREFDAIGIEYLPSSANFILLNIGKIGIDSGEFTKRMLAEGIFIRDCASFGLPRSVRVAVRTRGENERLAEALKKCWH